MNRFSRGRALLVSLAAFAIALSACGSTSATPTPSVSGGTNGPGATSQPSGPAGASSALGNLTSYKFTMTIAGGSLGDLLAGLPDAIDEGPFSVSGTVINKPQKAADVTVAGLLHVISVGGFDYQDVGLTGMFTKSESGGMSEPSGSGGPGAGGPGLADSLLPAAVCSSVDLTTGFERVGAEQKNGVEADHYQATASSLAQYASTLGIADASWTGDVWIAKEGGYPVSLSIVARDGATSAVIYQMTFDLTNVNDSANSVTAPENVAGE